MKDIKEAKYFKSIDNDINTVIVTYKSSESMTFVPMDEGNSDYAEILKQVKEGTLTIKDAD
tara:strand:- start:735 stop:917 length:183 start_codon:yes stop_codon:yes gene_type:complete